MNFTMLKFSFGLTLLFVLISDTVIYGAEPKNDNVTEITIGDANTVQATFQVVRAGKISLVFRFAEGPPQIIEGQVVGDTLTRQTMVEGKKSIESKTLPDAAIEFKGTGLNFQLHTRPYLKRYTEAQREEIVQRWEWLSAASQHWITCEVRQVTDGAQLWLDGRYCGTLKNKSKLKSLTFTCHGAGQVTMAKSVKNPETNKYLPLSIEELAMQPNVMSGAKVSTNKGELPSEVPLQISPDQSNLDVGLVKLMQGLKSLETNEFTSRTSLDSMPEALHWSVPQEFYRRAWLLCALEPDPKKDPVLTVRLTRYGVSGRGSAMADTIITFPHGDEKAAHGIKQIGEVKYSTPDGEKTVPFFLVEVPLKSGEIVDLLTD